MTQRVFNFNPGPAALPLVVLEQVKMEMLDFQGTGMSILEISHRSKAFESVLDSAIQRVRRMLGLDDSYHVLFMQGGASLQFTLVPMNLAVAGRPADYVNTGSWATRAIKEARTLGQRGPGSRNLRGEGVYLHSGRGPAQSRMPPICT